MNNIQHIPRDKHYRQEDERRAEGNSINQELTIRSQAPIYTLKTANRKRSVPLLQFILWLGAIAVIVGFFWIQVKLDQLPKDWAHTTLLYMSVIVEYGLLSLLNSMLP